MERSQPSFYCLFMLRTGQAAAAHLSLLSSEGYLRSDPRELLAQGCTEPRTNSNILITNCTIHFTWRDGSAAPSCGTTARSRMEVYHWTEAMSHRESHRALHPCTPDSAGPEPLPWTQGGQRHGARRHDRGTGLRHDRDADFVEDGEAQSRPYPPGAASGRSIRTYTPGLTEESLPDSSGNRVLKLLSENDHHIRIPGRR